MALIELSEDEFAEAIDIARRVARPQLGKDRVDDLEDVAQEAILRLITQDPPPENWRAWINTISHRLAMDVHRREARLDPLEEWSSVAGNQLRWFVSEALSTSEAGMLAEGMRFMTIVLSERDRRLILASREGASPEQLAEEFGLKNAATASQTLTRIRKKLREHLSAYASERRHPRPY